MKKENQTKERVILHSDVNNFFASVECATREDLKNMPVAVTGNPKKRTGIILAKNELAKRQGVKTGQVIAEALALCPDLVCLPPHYDLYEEYSSLLHNIYLSYTNYVEPLGLDECWLDVTGSLKYLNKTGKEIADEIRARVKSELGLTVSVGVSFSKIFAKLGSDLKKPDATTMISSDNFRETIYPLPLNSIVGIGRRLEKKFSSIDVKTIGDFVNLEESYLQNLMGITGVHLQQNLKGERIEPVADYYSLPPPKSVGNGTTTIVDITSREDLAKVVYFLAEKVSHRMIKHKVVGGTLSLTIKDKSLHTVHKSMKITPTNSIKELASQGMKIADQIWSYAKPIRAVRLKASSLSDSSFHQMSMFESDKSDYSETIKLINEKFGKIGLASDKSSFINTSSHPQE